MNVCVAGWYYWPEVYSTFNDYAPGHNVVVIANEHKPPYNAKFRESFRSEYENLKFVIGPNYGLDLGKYDFYLKNIWDGENGVFFVHDDIIIQSRTDPFLIVENEIKDNDIIAFFGFAYEKQCFGTYKQMRALYISADYLDAMLSHRCTCIECRDHFNTHIGKHVKALPPHSGFFHDPNNKGVTDNSRAISGMRDINVGVRHFFKAQWRALRVDREWKSKRVLNNFITHAIRGVRPKIRENLK